MVIPNLQNPDWLRQNPNVFPWLSREGPSPMNSATVPNTPDPTATGQNFQWPPAYPGIFNDPKVSPEEAMAAAAQGASTLFQQPFSPWQMGLLSQMTNLANQDVTTPMVRGLDEVRQQYGAVGPYGPSGAGTLGYQALGNLADTGQAIAGQTPYLEAWQRPGTDQLSGMAGTTAQMAALDPRTDPLFGSSLARLNKSGLFGDIMGSVPAYAGTYETQGQEQLGGIQGLINRLEGGGAGLTPQEQQTIFDQAYQRAATPIEARLRRSGFNSEGQNAILAGVAKDISTNLALDDANRRFQALQQAGGLRERLASSMFGEGRYGAGFRTNQLGTQADIELNRARELFDRARYGSQFDMSRLGQVAGLQQSLADRLLGEARYGAQFGREGLQSQADILNQLAQTAFGQGQYEGGFGLNQLGAQEQNVLNQAALSQAGLQNMLSNMGSLQSIIRSGQLTPIDYLTALAGQQGISRATPNYPSSAKLADYLSSASAMKSLVGG